MKTNTDPDSAGECEGTFCSDLAQETERKFMGLLGKIGERMRKISTSEWKNKKREARICARKTLRSLSREIKWLNERASAKSNATPRISEASLHLLTLLPIFTLLPERTTSLKAQTSIRRERLVKRAHILKHTFYRQT